MWNGSLLTVTNSDNLTVIEMPAVITDLVDLPSTNTAAFALPKCDKVKPKTATTDMFLVVKTCTGLISI